MSQLRMLATLWFSVTVLELQQQLVWGLGECSSSFVHAVRAACDTVLRERNDIRLGDQAEAFASRQGGQAVLGMALVLIIIVVVLAVLWPVIEGSVLALKEGFAPAFGG
jgi:hypothetical protein